MSRRGRVDVAQMDLFAADTGTPVTTVVPAPRPEIRAGFGGKPDVVAQVLWEIYDGRYGRLDCNDRIVSFDGEGHCRYASDDVAEVVESLLAQRFAQLGSHVQVRHGAIRKDAYPVDLASTGRTLLSRWSALRIRGSR